MTAVCTIRLTAPEVWRPQLAAACQDVPVGVADLARAIVRSMHDAHLGMPPAMAVELAQLVSESRAYVSQEGPWSAVFERLTNELRTQGRGTHALVGGRRQRVGLLLTSSPLYSVLGLAKPIMALTVQQLGRNFLFCEDDAGTEVDEAAYEDYAEEVVATIKVLAASDEPKLSGFWRDRALTLAGLSRQALPGQAAVRNLPRTDQTTMALLETARPQVLLPPPPRNEPRRPPALRAMRRLHKLKEGGVDGIRVSRRPEEISSMLYSEYMKPRPLMADRLLNSGFLAIRREPRYESLRDVLVAALVPGELANPVHTPILKLAYYELCLRLGFILSRHRLFNTVFRWVEGHRLGGVRDMAFGLEAMPKSGQPLLGFQPDEAFRRNFLAALGWLPKFADRQGPYQRDHRGALEALRQQADGPGIWLKQAWRGFPQPKSEPPAVSAERFSFVHVLVLAPENYRYQDRSLNLVRTRALLGLKSGGHESLSLTVVPQDINDATGWHFKARYGEEAKACMPENDLGDATAMAGRLTTLWLTTLLGEIWRG